MNTRQTNPTPVHHVNMQAFWSSLKFILPAIGLVFAAGGAVTKIYLVVDQMQVDQIEGNNRIVKSIDKQTESILNLTETLSDHEARLRVNEVHIRDLREKTKHKHE